MTAPRVCGAWLCTRGGTGAWVCVTKMAAEDASNMMEDVTACADPATNSSSFLFSSQSEGASSQFQTVIQRRGGEGGVAFPAGQSSSSHVTEQSSSSHVTKQSSSSHVTELSSSSHVTKGDKTVDQEVLQDLLELAGDRTLVEFGDLKEQESTAQNDSDVMEYQQAGRDGEGAGDENMEAVVCTGEHSADDTEQQDTQNCVRYEYHQHSQPQLVAGSWCQEFSRHREHYFKGCKW